MNYLTIELIKKQLRLEDDFTEDNTLLEALGEAAEDYVQSHLNMQLDEIAADNSGELPKAINQAMLILVSYFYDNDGSGDNKEIPNAFYMLLAPYKKYAVQ